MRNSYGSVVKMVISSIPELLVARGKASNVTVWYHHTARQACVSCRTGQCVLLKDIFFTYNNYCKNSCYVYNIRAAE